MFTSALGFNLLLTGLTPLSPNLATLLVLRFLAGFLGSLVLTVGPATINDLWNTERGSSRIAILATFMPFLGIPMGPFAGGWVMYIGSDWKWLMFFACCVGAPIFFLACFMPETSFRQICQRDRAERGLGPEEARPHWLDGFVIVSKMTVFRPLHMLVMEPLVALLDWHVAVAYGIFFSGFESYYVVFGRTYNFQAWEIGCALLGMATSAGLAAMTYRGLVLWTACGRVMDRDGKRPPPEARLYAAMLGSIFLPGSMLWYTWTASKHLHWYIPFLGGSLYGYGAMLLIYGTISYHLDV